MYQIIASYFIYSGLPSNLNYNWNFGSLLGVVLAMQIATGVSLGMHYTANVDLSFILVEQIMRDVQYGWLLRYMHANGASLFFLLVYLHIGRALYSGSYLYPRHKLFNYGVVIYLIMMGTAFLGYFISPKRFIYIDLIVTHKNGIYLNIINAKYYTPFPNHCIQEMIFIIK
jgi:ubiquinol-cytochrome c reductase cytochrome b subunit